MPKNAEQQKPTESADIPDTIKVGYARFSVEMISRAEASSSGFLGETNTEQLRIKVADDLPPQELAEVMLHEVMHAVYYVWKLDRGRGEEDFVAPFAAGLASVFVDNPAFVTWLQENLK